MSLFLCGALLVSAGIPSFAQSKQGSVLFVAPHRLVIAPDKRVDVLNVANNSDQARRYDLQLVDQVMGENGITERKENFDYSIKKMVKFVPKRFSLKPGEKQTVRLMVKRPKDLADGDYHSHLLFREVPLSVKDKKEERADNAAAAQTATFEIRTLYGVAVPIVVQHGVVESSIKMEAAKVSKSEDGKFLAVTFVRQGNAEAQGKFRAEYVPPGQDPIELATPQFVRIYRERDVVQKEFSLKDIPATGGKIVMYLALDEKDDSKTQVKEIKL